MEDPRDLNSPDRDTSEGESVSPAPSLPSPPILPLQVAQQAHRTTNFFIDNILRPDFGCKKELGGQGGAISRQDRAQQQQQQTASRGEQRALHQHPSVVVVRPNHPGTPCQDSNCSSDSTTSSSTASSLSPKTTTTTTTTTTSTTSRTLDEGSGGGAGTQNTTASSVVVLNGGSGGGGSGGGAATPESQPLLWPAWVYCTRYSDRPSSGPRTRKLKKTKNEKEDKRPRTAFTAEQLQRLKTEFQANRYITEQRRQSLAQELNLNESQIKIWFQNKRAKIKKATGFKNGLALQLMAQGLYNHSTTTIQEDKEDSD